MSGTLFVLAGLTVISPVMFSLYAVNLVNGLTNSSDYQMIRLTPLADDDVLEGITRVALFRLRVLRMIVIGFAPIFGLLIASEFVFGWNKQWVMLPHQITTAAIGIEYAVLVWAAQGASITRGVKIALRHNSGWEAMFLTVLMALLTSVALYIFVGFYFVGIVVMTYSLFVPVY